MLAYTHTLQALRTSLHISLLMRTRQGDGNILYILGASQYITISLDQNELHLLNNLNADGNKSVPPFSYNIVDGQWHKVIVDFTASEMSIFIQKLGSTDNYSYQGSFSNDFSQLLADSPSIFLGGVLLNVINSNPEHFRTSQFFKGCLDEVRIGDIILPFFDESELTNSSSAERFKVSSMADIRTGCHGDPVCDSDGCTNGATCEDIFNDYQCLCALGFNGTDCEININDCVQHRCLHGAACKDGIANYTCTCVPGYTGDM